MIRCLALGIAVLLFERTAHAQSVEVVTFAESSAADVAVPPNFASLPNPRRSVDDLLRSFFSTDADSPTALALRPLQSSSCSSAHYAPALWLSADVERRRRLHFDAISQAACEAGISLGLLEAVVAQESAYRTLAVSRAGAKGLTQLMPGTAEALGVARPFEPLTNLRGGARYLRKQLDRFRRVDLALAAYNAGPERQALKKGRIPNITETHAYVRSVLSNWERFAQHHLLAPTDTKANLTPRGPHIGREALLATFQVLNP